MKKSTLHILFIGFFSFFIIQNIEARDIEQDIQVYTMPNYKNKITPQTIEEAFNSLGLDVVGNNDMNKPFLQRFKKVHYKVYNLAMFMNSDLSFRLLKKYPQFGALLPLTMSIWQDKNNNINISTLTFHAMARSTQIPDDDPDLRAYAKLIHNALKKALPQGKFKKLHVKSTHKNRSYQINFSVNIVLGKDEGIEDYIDDFEEEFEGEMESLGFLFPNITNVQDEIFDEYEYNIYDFYHTYSICKFDVIYPVSKLHPEAGAWAPCSYYIYKKKDENKMYMGFLGVNNWISTLNITDEASIKPLKEAQGMIQKIIYDMIE